VTGARGERYAIDQPTILASNGRIHGRLVGFLSGRRGRG
jgi:hypothetical protein